MSGFLGDMFSNFQQNFSNSLNSGILGRGNQTQDFQWWDADNPRTFLGGQPRPTGRDAHTGSMSPPPPDNRGNRLSDGGNAFDERFTQQENRADAELQDLFDSFVNPKDASQDFQFSAGIGGGSPITPAGGPQSSEFNFLDPDFQDMFSQNLRAQLLSSFSGLLTRDEASPMLEEFGINLPNRPQFNSSLLNRLGPNVRL